MNISLNAHEVAWAVVRNHRQLSRLPVDIQDALIDEMTAAMTDSAIAAVEDGADPTEMAIDAAEFVVLEAAADDCARSYSHWGMFPLVASA